MSPNELPPSADQPVLFADAPSPPASDEPATKEARLLRGIRGVRLRKADRSQVSWGRIDLDAQLCPDHPVRALFAVVERLDLSAFYALIEARDDRAGTSAIDPKILLCLWVYALSQGEGSGRELARLAKLHAAYRWLCGGVSISAHTLTDFRTKRRDQVDGLITQVLTILRQKDLVDLHRIAKDGTRIRASAGAASFRSEQTLQAIAVEVRAHLAQVTEEGADPDLSARRFAARKRGAKERLARLEAALLQIPEVAEVKKRSGAKDKRARVSTTDPEARVMKMGDGGFRPAYNVQFAATCDQARVIVGVSLNNQGSDTGQATPMRKQVQERTGTRPREQLVDGGYAQHEAIDEAYEDEVILYAPVPKPRKEGQDLHLPQKNDSEAVVAWRQRMGTDEAKEIYKQRAATIETVNADAKTHRALDHFAVRGLPGVLGCALLFALSYDILRLIALNG